MKESIWVVGGNETALENAKQQMQENGIQVSVDSKMEHTYARSQVRAHRAEIALASGWQTSKDASMQKVNDLLLKLRRDSMKGVTQENCILITGQPGTGKTALSWQLHATSHRAKSAWIVVDCTPVDGISFEAECCGHERTSSVETHSMTTFGAFDLANGGTLVLDDIDRLSAASQEFLYQTFSKKTYKHIGGGTELPVHIQLICTTTKNLRQMTNSGKFNQNLFNLIESISFELPTLQTRFSDIYPCCVQMAQHAFAKVGKEFEGFSNDAETALRSYSWPGNLRELATVIDRVSLTHQGGAPISVSELGLPEAATHAFNATQEGRPNLALVASPFTAPSNSGATGYMELKKSWTDQFESQYLAGALKRNHGNVSAAAREAMLDRSNFLRLLRRHGLHADTFRDGTGAHEETATVTATEIKTKVA